jgi:hypothetical protein
MFGVGIALPSFLAPPSADGGYGEGGGFVRHTDEQETAIGLRVEDAIENRHALSLRAKIVVNDRGGNAFPDLAPAFLKFPTSSRFLASTLITGLRCRQKRRRSLPTWANCTSHRGWLGPIFLRFLASRE